MGKDSLAKICLLADRTDFIAGDRLKIQPLTLPPTAIYSMLSHPKVRDFDYSSLQYFFYTAAPMSVAKLREAIDVFGPVMTTMFGQVEAPATCTFTALPTT